MSQIDAFFQVGSDSCASDCVIEAYGAVDGDASQRLRHIIAAGMGEYPSRLIIDLAGVTFIDRPALRVLAAARTFVRSMGTDLVLRSPSEATVRRIDLAGLGDQLPVVYVHGDGILRPNSAR